MVEHILVKCPRCSSISEVSSDSIRTSIFLCPVCHEGEIQYSPEQPAIEKAPGSRSGNEACGHYMTAVINCTTNWRQEYGKKYNEAFILRRKRIYTN
jgi:hypothetical protein